LAWAPACAAQNSKNKNAAQEKKDDARVKNARQDVSSAQKKIDSVLKELAAAKKEAENSFEAIATAKKAMDDTSNRLERWISQNLGIPAAIEAQRTAQAAYDEAAKPMIAAMKANPKYLPLVERADKADKFLKSLPTNTVLDETTRRQQESAALKELADLRSTVSSYLESLPELKYPREKLVAAQTKLAELRGQLKKQLELHPDLMSAEKKWSQSKVLHEKNKGRLATLGRNLAAEQSKLAAERAQLSKATMQDKQNDNKNNSKNNKGKNNKNAKKNNSR
jgi:hypothetical protein